MTERSGRGWRDEGGEILVAPQPAIGGIADRPPGERYYRHPGDVVRFIVWGAATVLIALFVTVATGTSDGLRTDLGNAAAEIPLAARELLLGAVQVGAVAAPLAVAAVLAARRRWRRLATVVAAGAVGAMTAVLLEAMMEEPPPVAKAIGGESWLISTRFPTVAYLAGAVAVGAVGKPWLSRRWRRAADVAVVVLAVAMAVAGSAGVPELALFAAAGGLAGAVVLVAVGAPNRRPTQAEIASALGEEGLLVERLAVERAAGGRAQLYRAYTPDGSLFLKVYGPDTRDADLLYRSYRNAVLRDAGEPGTASTIRDVEHEALLLMLAARGGVACPSVQAIVALPDGSIVLACDDVGGDRLDDAVPRELIDDLLVNVWRQVAALHAAGLAHGALRAANVLVQRSPSGIDPPRPVLIDFGAGVSAAGARLQAIDRAELLSSLASLVSPEAAVASAAHVVAPEDLAAAMPYLQPLALSAATRRAVSKSALRAMRDDIATTTGREPVPLERLIRVRPRTVFTIAALTGAFYVLLPQLANVDDSVDAIGSANWLWLAGAVVMSGCTYVAAAIGMLGGIRENLPFIPTVQVSLASSFVNRVTPANVGGMALNVRYMQKAGVPPAEAVTGVGLNVVAGGIVHVALLVVFFAWAGQADATAFSLPSSSKLLVGIVAVLALAGAVLATRWGRQRARAHVLPAVRQSLTSIASLARSPMRLAALFGGSIGVTLAYVGALAFAVAAFDGDLSFAQVGAVFLGASLIAAAAPTPGGLGAMEAALVAGLTGVGMNSAIAVATVLSYRLVTFWLPILPGWLCFHVLDRRDYI